MKATGKKVLKIGLAVMFLFTLGSSQQVKQAKSPVLPDKPFIVVWNAPTEQCRLRYKVNLDLRVFDIVTNPNETLSGSNVTIFYHDRLGYYPYYSHHKKPVNGGLPQNESLAKHLKKAESDIDRFLPFKNFHGLGVIDWENWRPQWIRNWGLKDIYRNKSKELVKKYHPHWSVKKIRKEARKQFEAAGKDFMNRTLLLAEQMRPNGLWGYYLFPDCYNYDYKKDPHKYTGKCPDIEYIRNDRLLWLWEESTALYPSIYLEKKLKSTANALKFVHYRVKEAVRVASIAKKDYALPIFVYSRPFYTHSIQALTEEDLISTIGQSAAMGAAGVVLWGSMQYARSKKNCLLVKENIDGPLGHYVINVTSAAELCSKVLCSKNGKCIRQSLDSGTYLHLNPSSFTIKTNFATRGPKFFVTGEHTDEDVKAMKQKFMCQCYQGWVGMFCEQPDALATARLVQFPSGGTADLIMHLTLIILIIVLISQLIIRL
ncbi:hyaluronoglucosaminidase 6 [Latimeria chalumnae]|uniref:Hyaluronidase n=1 Tax=Latimeria chalumnae TaxID=7897 RepID=H2ZZ86_LATCH|nr:PREDICTED: hyaluronidase-1-like [Latimeria chalumnae]XP_006012183.1 PREDICTED: hyaluronidase-1-like [Latimeria chalumnae]XP_014353884.1 PREDICTED: hyaluronidase-1-like [Latimeria chalumnae]|eukprot:XP_006012182.1 PREDICTED: hyaluronidase-1-like [Latimeria chalumnae]